MAAQTPEGRVKAKITRLLIETGTYYIMPVTGGYGASGLDYHGISKGRGFVVEAKRPGKVPTPRQTQTANLVAMSGGWIFMVSNDDELEELREWLLAPVLWVST